MGEDGSQHAFRPDVDDHFNPRVEGAAAGPRDGHSIIRFASREDEVLRAFVLAEQMGRNAARMLGRDSSIRLLVDSLAVRQPTPGARAQAPANFQQGEAWNVDRPPLGVYVALDEITPEMGPMWFMSGTHVLGSLGYGIQTPERRESWERLRRYEARRPDGLAAGDATVHLSTVLFGSPENAGTAGRWMYVIGYVPGDALYTGSPNVRTDGLGLEPFQPIDHPNFPVVYAPSS
jgi:hypothetical protein